MKFAIKILERWLKLHFAGRHNNYTSRYPIPELIKAIRLLRDHEKLDATGEAIVLFAYFDQVKP